MSTSEISEYIVSCAARRDIINEAISKDNDELGKLKANIIDIETAQAIAIEAAHDTQTQLSERIVTIVQCALETVFSNSHYEFNIVFGQRGGKSQIELVLTDNGQEVNDYGGGLRDIISFALRLAIQSISTTDKVLVLDEPMKFLSADMRECGAQLLSELSHKLGLQIICVTHIPEIMAIADKAFTVVKHGDKSQIV